VTLHNRKVTKTLPKIKILRQYQIPVGDPSGTLSVIGLKNGDMRRIYTTLMLFCGRMYNVHYGGRSLFYHHLRMMMEEKGRL